MPAASRSRPRSSTWFTARCPAPRSIAMHFSSQDAQPTSGIQRISRFSTQACGGNTTICAIVSQVEVCFHMVTCAPSRGMFSRPINTPVEAAEDFREPEIRARPGAREVVERVKRQPAEQHDHEPEDQRIEKQDRRVGQRQDPLEARDLAPRGDVFRHPAVAGFSPAGGTGWRCAGTGAAAPRGARAGSRARARPPPSR